MPSNPRKSPSTPIHSGYLFRSPFDPSNLLDRPVFSSPRQYPPDLFDGSDDEEVYEGDDAYERGGIAAEQGYPRLGSLTKNHPIGPGQFSPFLMYTSSQPLRRSPTPAGTTGRQRAIYHDPVPTLVMSDSTQMTVTLPTPATSMMTSDERGPSAQKRSRSKRSTRGLIRLTEHPDLQILPANPVEEDPTDTPAHWRTRLGLDHTSLSHSIPIDDADHEAELSTVREEMTRCWVSASIVEREQPEWSDVQTVIPFHPAGEFEEEVQMRGDAGIAGASGRGRRRGR